MNKYSFKYVAAPALMALGLMLAGCQQNPPGQTVVEVPAATPAPTPSPTPAPTTESTTSTKSTEVKPSDPMNPDPTTTTTKESTTTKKKQ